MIYGEFEIELEHADIVYNSLLPELRNTLSQRSNISLALEGGTIKLKVEADDIVSLRAALNTWLRLIKIAYDMVVIK
ncbi:MAG: KEOPS complex subunit Pcc1 [Methanocellales archaeon]|nr:KEOPS complex subunit Pcc1 [Methanocellales archaeon]MDI6859761.1 KEOPS complex subunit Pcc1 [Methanocellales archaeon]